ncbi:MAG: hypothetical protein SO159_05435 [Dialister sp.]|jgi:hypothetical protein|nr:hypothetical protein [Dialister sp.]MCI6917329.1 hypothetical protein [Dialister sp.]MCI7172428.1 hypothetical protein [Dialister sp.]MCI7319713.1 hypothetical protein [Dialister sp.]MDD7072885.1 hypothetical protein [Dialister sp.]
MKNTRVKAAGDSMRMPLFPLLSFEAKARDADILVGITLSILIVFADFTAWYVTFIFL